MKQWIAPAAVALSVGLATAAAAQDAAAIRAADVVKAQSDAIERLVEDHRTLVARRPSTPAIDADASAEEAHRDALATWTTRMDRLEDRIRAALSRLDVAQQRLDSLTAADHPAPLVRDVESARKAAADARSNARRALATPQAS